MDFYFYFKNYWKWKYFVFSSIFVSFIVASPSQPATSQNVVVTTGRLGRQQLRAAAAWLTSGTETVEAGEGKNNLEGVDVLVCGPQGMPEVTTSNFKLENWNSKCHEWKKHFPIVPHGVLNFIKYLFICKVP